MVSISGFDSSLDSVLARPRVGVGVVAEDGDTDADPGSYRENDLVVVSLEGLPLPAVAIVRRRMINKSFTE